MVESLRERLIRFRTAYYRVWMIRGLLLTGVWSLLLLILFALSEGIFWWDVPVRRILWVIWVGGSAALLGRWVLYPLLQYGLKLRGYLSDEEAARWIGRRMPEIKDKLLNTLQLSQQDAAGNAAIALAIDERMQQLSVLPWEITLPHKEVRRYSIAFLGVLGLLGLLWVISPSFFRAGTLRFLQPSRKFSRPLPYEIYVKGIKPFYRRGEPLSLTFLLKGEKLPTSLYASSESGILPLRKESAEKYSLSLPAVHQSFMIRIETEGSTVYTVPIQVLSPPALHSLFFVCHYPPYTRKGVDTFPQPFLRVLQGSQVSLVFSVKSERPYSIRAEGLSLQSPQKDLWQATLSTLTSATYTLCIQETFFSDSFQVQVEVYPDYHPSVQIFTEWFNPQTLEQGLRVRLMDDFGFTRANLWYRIVEGAKPGRAYENFKAYPLSIGQEALQDRTLTVSWSNLGVQMGDKVEYYIEVWDNDALTGPKSSRSILYTLEPISDAAKQEVFAQLQDSLFKAISDIRRELEKMLSAGDVDQQRKQTATLSEKFRSLRSELRALQRLAAEQQLFTPELLEYMHQLQKLLDAIDPQKAEQLLSQYLQSRTDTAKVDRLIEELNKAYREWQEKLQRLESLLPDYQKARRLEQLMTHISEIIEQQAQLRSLADSLQRQTAAQQLQRQLLEETRKIQGELDTLRRESLSGVLRDSLSSASQYLKEAEHAMQEALENMQQAGDVSPQKSQDKAVQSLEKALSAIDQGSQQSGAEEEAESYEALRLLLKGILSLSFRQETVRKKTQEAASFLSSVPTLVEEQNTIRQDYKQVQDSLYALAHRSPIIEESIMDLLRDMEQHFKGLSFHQAAILLRRQQYILQGLNRLANLLTEILAQLEENQQNRQQCGGAACQRSFKVRRKGASGRPTPSPRREAHQPASMPRSNPLPSLQQLQRQLNEALERAITPDPSSEKPGTLSPEERARISAQQELIRLRLQEWLRQHPGDAGQLQGLIEEMQKAEKEILGGALTQERLKRQQQILTRLLDYEKSQHEKELDPERESRTAQQFFQRTTGIYPRPTFNYPAAKGLPPLWLYHPTYQNLIERYLQKP
ncbi:MAG: hypothetical protein RMJ66_04605 [Bacteroidia bacterium]|nr:hypothetical protein [Bacteroidia bacterium]MDW8134327.1 hypothetical protein [Bacteroidia bacterium]